jgi:UDP-2,4-diacetamido-2,4,6-trideoxy-beta-L-altropyranose hydrolase
MASQSAPIEKRLIAQDMRVEYLTAAPGSEDDAFGTAACADELEARWIAADGYLFGGHYQEILKETGDRLLVIDDYGHADKYHADLILNQNLHAHESLYSERKKECKLLLGTRYTLLRSEFLKRSRRREGGPEVARKFLLTLGGSDSENITLKVMKALDEMRIHNLQMKIAIGGNNPHLHQLQTAEQNSPLNVRLLNDVHDMPALLDWADIAIAAGGSTAWELAFMGVPSLLLILSDNQRPVADRLQLAGAAVNLGWHEDLDPKQMRNELTKLMTDVGRRQEMSRRGQELIDGRGAHRVVMQMNRDAVMLRRAGSDDCRRLWTWANEKEVRAFSFHSDPIPWENHVSWFNTKINDPQTFLYVAYTAEEEALGQARIEIEGRRATISVSIDREFRGQGYGSLIISLASQRLFLTSESETICAYVKPANKASAFAFLKAGFKEGGMAIIHGHQALEFVGTRQELL